MAGKKQSKHDAKFSVDYLMEQLDGMEKDKQKVAIREIREMMVDNYGNVIETGGQILGFILDRVKYRFPKDRARTRKIAHELYETHPLAKWFINMVTSFVIGGGAEISVGDNPLLKALVNRFMKLNDIKYYKRKFYRADMLDGEGFYRLFFVKKDGAKVRAKEHDVIIRRLATNVVDINFNPADPQDVYYYELRWYDPTNRQQVVERVFPFDKFIENGGITEDAVQYSPKKAWKYVTRGDSCIIHFKMNDMPNSVHGTSDVKVLFEWLDMYAEFLRNGLLQCKLRGGGAYDITIHTEDQDKFDIEAAKYADWTIGSNFVHNDATEIDTLEFSSPLENFEELRRAILLMFISGTGLSEHYTGDASSGSRAQGQSMELPQMKGIEDRQEDIQWLWENIFRVVLSVQLLSGIPAPIVKDEGLEIDIASEIAVLDDEKVFSVKFPSVSKRDRRRLLENLKLEKELGTTSPQTMSKDLGRDYKLEQRNIGEYIKDYPNNPLFSGGSQIGNSKDENKSDTDSNTDDEPSIPDDGSASPEDRQDTRQG